MIILNGSWDAPSRGEDADAPRLLFYVAMTRARRSWLIHDARERALGRMARTWSPPDGLNFLRGEVGAVVRWRKADNKEEFRAPSPGYVGSRSTGACVWPAAADEAITA